MVIYNWRIDKTEKKNKKYRWNNFIENMKLVVLSGTGRNWAKSELENNFLIFIYIARIMKTDKEMFIFIAMRTRKSNHSIDSDSLLLAHSLCITSL